MIPLIVAAGAVQLAVALANFHAARVLRLDDEFGRLSPIVRDIARAHHAYIVGVLVAAATLCLAFPAELSDGRPLGAFLSAGLALFWGARLFLQLFRYDPETRRRHRLGDLLFTLTAAGLCAVFLASLGRAFA
jgi:hypothetical protein